MMCGPGTERTHQRPPPVPQQMVCSKQGPPVRYDWERRAKDTSLSFLKGGKKGVVQKQVPGQMTNSTLSSPPRTIRERGAKETSVSTLQGKKKEAVEEVAEQMTKTMPMSPERNAREPGAKDTAVKETSTRTVEKQTQILGDGQESKRRHHKKSGRAPSTSEPFMAHGLPTCLEQKPEALKRSITPETSDDPMNKRARPSSMCSLTRKLMCGVLGTRGDATRSSYSSPRGVSHLWKKRGPTSTPLHRSASSCCQRPERPIKNTGAEGLGRQHSYTTPRMVDKESQGDSVADATTEKQEKSSTSPSTSGSSASRKRKFQQLPSRLRDPVTLPSPPLLASPIAPEDPGREKRGRFVLEQKSDASSNGVTKEHVATKSCLTLSPPATGPASLPASLPSPTPDPGAIPLPASPKPMQNLPTPPSSPGPARVITTAAPAPAKPPGLTLSPLAARLASLAAFLPTPAADPGATPLLDSQKTMQNPDGAPSLTGPAGVLSTAAPAPAKPSGFTLSLPEAGPPSFPDFLPNPAPEPGATPLLASQKQMQNMPTP